MIDGKFNYISLTLSMNYKDIFNFIRKTKYIIEI